MEEIHLRPDGSEVGGEHAQECSLLRPYWIILVGGEPFDEAETHDEAEKLQEGYRILWPDTRIVERWKL